MKLFGFFNLTLKQVLQNFWSLRKHLPFKSVIPLQFIGEILSQRFVYMNVIFFTGYYKGYYQTEYFQRQLAMTNQSSSTNYFNSSISGGKNLFVFIMIFQQFFYYILYLKPAVLLKI